MSQRLSKAEWRAVECHRAQMMNVSTVEIPFDDALRDWLDNHAMRWRAKRHASMLQKQREEILRHKWIESEKAERDLGAEAVFDWIHRYAATWRDWYEDTFDGTELLEN